MKKFLSLLLAAMMLLSCASAMATNYDTIIDGTATWKAADEEGDEAVTGDDANADIDVLYATNYADTGLFDTQGEAETEIWLQVDATGQIDVTVPLVLLFQTNIDGGHATSPSAYKIINNTTSDLVVTKIVTTEVAAKTNTNPSNQPMELVDYPENNDKPQEDKYAVRIKNISGVKGTGTDVKNVYDLHKQNTYENNAKAGGLFELLKKTANATTGEPTTLNVEMITGPLSFVTARNDDDTAVAQDKGIQLLTITYTVAIDTSDAIGEDISTTPTLENQTIKEKMESNAQEMNTTDPVQ